LSAVARRTGPARQRAVAAWPPRAASTARDKVLSGRRRAPTAPSRCSPAQPPTASCRAAPTASLAPPASRPRRVPPGSRRPDRRCPSRAVTVLRGERRPTASPHRSSPVELELTLLSLLTVAGPPPATVAPHHRGDAFAEPDFFSSPSTRSSGELACRSPCPAGSLTLVGARPPPFAPPPPL
jgi:hypothetical protein